MASFIPLRLLIAACLSSPLAAIHARTQTRAGIQTIASELLLQGESKLHTLVSEFTQTAQQQVDHHLAQGDLAGASRQLADLFKEAVNTTGSGDALRAVAQSGAELLRQSGIPCDKYGVYADPVINVGVSMAFTKAREELNPEDKWYRLSKLLTYFHLASSAYLSINVGSANRGRTRVCGVLEGALSYQAGYSASALDIGFGVEANQPGNGFGAFNGFRWDADRVEKGDWIIDGTGVEMYSAWALPPTGMESSVGRGMSLCKALTPKEKQATANKTVGMQVPANIREPRKQGEAIPPPIWKNVRDGKVDNKTIMSLREWVTKQMRPISRDLSVNLEHPFRCLGMTDEVNFGLFVDKTWCSPFLFER